MIPIPTKLDREELAPYKAYDGTSAAYDLKANIEHCVALQPMDRKLIKTGVKLHIPTGLVALVCPRSGMALKNGITIMNAPGIIDPGYVDDIGVILVNLSNQTYVVEPNDKIAQLLILHTADTQLATHLNFDTNTVRGLNGYGSSGKI